MYSSDGSACAALRFSSLACRIVPKFRESMTVLRLLTTEPERLALPNAGGARDAGAESLLSFWMDSC